jgi:hypothetical protein
MSNGVNHGTKEDRVGGDLVEPNVLINGDEFVDEGDAKDTEDVTADGEENDGAIPDKTHASTTGDPERVVERFIQVDQVFVQFDAEDAKDEEDDVEDEPGDEEGVTPSCPSLESLGHDGYVGEGLKRWSFFVLRIK